MRRYQGELILSPSDLVTFLGCAEATRLAMEELAGSLEVKRRILDGADALITERGNAFEAEVWGGMARHESRTAEIDPTASPLDRMEATLAAMREGVALIYQAELRSGRWMGKPDVLRRVERPSALGAWSYEPVDMKLKRTAQARHLVQLGVYARLLQTAQGIAPERVHLLLGDGREESFATAASAHYVARAALQLETFLEAPTAGPAEPCDACRWCGWRTPLCEPEWLSADHLKQVAGIRRTQMRKLREGGVGTLAKLAALPTDFRVARLAPETLAKLRAQARLQLEKRSSGEDRYELLPPADGRGFARMPAPAEGDLFFDMEGHPLLEEGREYLFGLGWQEGAAWRFRPFWGHDAPGEKAAFEATVDLITAHLARFPEAHIHHYAPYEVTALRKLSTRHGSREAAIDDLLRRNRFIDLYTVAREALRTSEPGMSIKNLETFYFEGRASETQSGGDSMVAYERWRETGEEAILADIEAYNADDVRSTRGLRDWLAAIRPADLPWCEPKEIEVEKQAAIDEREAQDAALADALTTAVARDRLEEETATLLSQLLGFHRREQKPEWWAMFDRREADEAELIEDPECLGGLSVVGGPGRIDRSDLWNLQGPPQDTKLRPGSKVQIAETGKSAGELVAVDAEKGVVQLKRGRAQDTLPARFSLIPDQPIRVNILREAVRRFATAASIGSHAYPGLHAYVGRRALATGGVSLRRSDESVLKAAVRTALAMEGGQLFVQGPPGAGKTWTCARVILALLGAGKRVGVSSNSHKAIDNLLHGIEAAAADAGERFAGVKKDSAGEYAGDWIVSVAENEDVLPRHQLVGGTAWLFARPEHDQAFDYLFVDEAGQVSLGNLVAMGTAARNLVLVGDQMQLGNPIKGAHPGECGASALEYLLQDEAVVTSDRGLFLDRSWRMHPDVCGYVSRTFYEGRLQSAPVCSDRRLVLKPDADPALRPTGVVFAPVPHEGNAQSSEEEAVRVAELHRSLLRQRFRDSDGEIQRITAADVLVVAPYNMQVNLLQARLGPSARVGTVDKFQGQEAVAVIVSMATSSGDDMPRGVAFLLSRNRLNVAVSRAQCLAVVVASPALLDMPVATPEALERVSMLCALAAFSEAAVVAA